MKYMINIIVAHDDSLGIGKENHLMWHLPGELKHFKKITTGHPIIMGRKTFESLPKHLPNRIHIVITRQIGKYSSQYPGIIFCSTLKSAIMVAQKLDTEIFVIGGGEIFKKALYFADRLYITHVLGEFDADVFFPKYSHQFGVSEVSDMQEENGLHYFFFTWDRLKQ